MAQRKISPDSPDTLTFDGDIYKVGSDKVDVDYTTYKVGNYQSCEVDV